jgi:Spy/CpxP family protein refolding chaperone
MTPDSRRRAGIWLAVVFFLGAGIGGVFGYSFAHRSYASTSTPTLSEPERRAKRVSDMTKELGLTAEQSSKLNSTLEASHAEMKTLHDKFDVENDAVRQKARNQVREFLTPEQLPKFEAYVHKLDEERKKQGPK